MDIKTHKKDKLADAVKAARMYYYQNLTSDAIAREMNVSRSTVSRLISFARENGLVDIRIFDPTEAPNKLAVQIRGEFDVKHVHVINVSEMAGEAEWLRRVAAFTAIHLSTMFASNMILGIAWGTTLSEVSKHLVGKNTYNSRIVQLNGAGNTQSMGNEYAGGIIMKFSEKFQARADFFPVPTFFDYPETKQVMWREGSIRRILDLQAKADLLLFSIGAVNAGIPSHVYSGGYLGEKDYRELKKYNVAGDIATTFFREDGSFDNIPLNSRSSGPDLNFFKKKHSVCVVSGLGKVNGIRAALKGGLIKELILDEPTARALVNGKQQTAG